MDDFTDRSQFRIGDLVVMPDRLIVMRDSFQVKFEPRWMQVLVMLAEHAGETLSTERLLIEVWGSTVYGDSPVSKTISYIRKSIGDDSRKPRYIETVSKVGYRLIGLVSLPEDYRRMPSERWTAGSPYVGLSAFDADHASVFCGRSRIVADLLRAMRIQIENQRRFVLIVGASGCGKTSLLRAGAIPLLTKPDGFDGLRALSVTTCDLAANGRNPLIPLTTALANWTLGGRPVFPPQTAEQLRALLNETPKMIEGFVSEAFRRHSERDLAEQPYAHLLLNVDHAEALVATTDIDITARDAFARVLQALCACPHVMVTMIARGDFYLKLIESLPALTEHKTGEGHLDVVAPRYGEIGEIIRSPAWKADLSFETDPETRTRLDDALRDAALSQPDALPLLQHTLQTLYERRNGQQQLTFAAYNDIGGLEGAVSHRAEQVFARLPANAQASLNTVLVELIVIQPDNDAVNARRTSIDAFDTDARTLVDAFTAARLFVRDHHNGQPTVGVVHEALLRRWPRAVEWTQDNRRLLQARARLQRSAARWVEEGRKDDHLLNSGQPLAEAIEAWKRIPDCVSEQEREFLRNSEELHKRRKLAKKIAIVALSISTVTSMIISIFAFHARNEALERRQETLRVIDFMVVDLADQLRPQANLKLLDSISHEALKILQSRNINNMSTPDLIQHSKALTLIGEISLKKADNSDALKAFLHANNVAKSALSKSGKSTPAMNEVGQTSFWIGYYHYKRNEFTKTLGYWNRYYSISQDLARIEPDNKQWEFEKSYAINNLGALHADLGKYETALSFFNRSLRIKEEASAGEAANESHRIELIDTQSWISRCQTYTGEIDLASAANKNQILSLRELVKNNAQAKSWKRTLANSLARSADVEMMRGDLTAANEQIRESVSLLSDLVKEEQDNKEWLRDLAFAHMKTGDIASQDQSNSSGNSNYLMASKIADQLALAAENNTEWKRLGHLIKVRHASTLEDSQMAEKMFSSAILDLERLYEKHPDDYSALVALSDAIARRAKHKQENGFSDLAEQDWRKILSLTQAIATTTKDPRIIHARKKP